MCAFFVIHKAVPPVHIRQ